MKLSRRSRQDTVSSVLDSATSIVGDLQTEEALRIDGNLKGSVKTTGALIVGANATVDGDINAGELRIFGRVIGRIECERRIEICDGGTLEGEVRTPSLVIEDGAKFEGQSVAGSTQSESQSLTETRCDPLRQMEDEAVQGTLRP